MDRAAAGQPMKVGRAATRKFVELRTAIAIVAVGAFAAPSNAVDTASPTPSADIVAKVFGEVDGSCSSFSQPGIDPRAALAVFGGVVGAIVGADVGGSGRAIAGGAAAGAAGGYAVGAFVKRRPTDEHQQSGAFALGPRDTAICSALSAEMSQLRFAVKNAVDSEGTECGVEPTDMQTDPAGALRLIETCATSPGKDGVARALATQTAEIRKDNGQTCADIARILARKATAADLTFPSISNIPSCGVGGSGPTLPTQSAASNGYSLAYWLAKMSSSVYLIGSKDEPTNRVLPAINGYAQYDLPHPGIDGFAAVVYRRNHRYVVAFRGTALASGFGAMFDNLQADASWLITGTEVTRVNASLIEQGADLLLAVHNKVIKTDPAAEFILTGHSLGGFIAQVLGRTTGLPVAAFNAPSGGLILTSIYYDIPSLEGQIPRSTNPAAVSLGRLRATTFSNKGASTSVNYRLLGDAVSGFGIDGATGFVIQNIAALTAPAAIRELGTFCTVYEPIVGLDLLQLHSIDYLASLLGRADIAEAPEFTDQRDGFPTNQKCLSVAAL